MATVVCLNNFKFYKTEVDAAKALNVHPSTVTRLLNKQIKSKDGIRLVRADDILDFSADNPVEAYASWLDKTKALLIRRKELEEELKQIDKELWRGSK